MDKFYYLIASLPTMIFDEKTPISTGDFTEECRKWMTDKELGYLTALDMTNFIEKEDDLEIIKGWKQFDLKLRNDLALIRDPHKPPIKKEEQRALKEQLEGKNPLEKEKIVERKRWDFLDGEEHRFRFDLNKVIIYGLKLKIVERMSMFDKEKGKMVLEKVCEVKDEQISW